MVSQPVNALDVEVGPFYDTLGVAAVVGVPTVEVAARREAHTLLAVETADGAWVYPMFQFTGSQVNPRLLPAIRAFAGSPAWAAALWFVTPNDDLDDMPPVAWLDAGRESEAVTSSARRTAGGWR